MQKREKEKVLKLKNALYDLKQAPRAWCSRIKAYFIKEDFKKYPSEHTLFTKVKEEGKLVILSIYIDDLIFSGNDKVIFDEFKSSMKDEFDMTNIGRMKFFLGAEIVQNHEGIHIHKKKYAHEILKKIWDRK